MSVYYTIEYKKVGCETGNYCYERDVHILFGCIILLDNYHMYLKQKNMH